MTIRITHDQAANCRARLGHIEKSGKAEGVDLITLLEMARYGIDCAQERYERERVSAAEAMRVLDDEALAAALTNSHWFCLRWPNGNCGAQAMHDLEDWGLLRREQEEHYSPRFDRTARGERVLRLMPAESGGADA